MTNKRFPLASIISLATDKKIAMTNVETTGTRTPWEGTLFNMGVMVRDRIYIGHVVREAADVIVVFADEGGERWDIPKKYISVVGKNVFCNMYVKDLTGHEVSKDSPLPASIRTDLIPLAT